MRSLVFGIVLATACSDSAVGTLTVKPDAHQVVVGGSTHIGAYLVDGTTADPKPVEAEWTFEPSGIITLSSVMNLQKITAVAAGHVVVTASAFDQTAQTGITVLSP